MRGLYRLAGPRAREARVHRVNSRHSGASYSGERDSWADQAAFLARNRRFWGFWGGFRLAAGGSGKPAGFWEILAKTGLVVVHSAPG